jgi:hypothetical protein
MSRKPFFIDSKFRPGDAVKWGPHACYVTSLSVSTTGILYQLSYWYEDSQETGCAFDYELDLTEPFEEMNV